MPNPKARRSEQDDSDRDEAPVRKKKKKKRKESREPSNWPMLSLYIGVGVVGVMLIGVLIWVFVKFAGGGPPAQPVAAFEKFNTDEEVFGFEYPAHWGGIL